MGLKPAECARIYCPSNVMRERIATFKLWQLVPLSEIRQIDDKHALHTADDIRVCGGQLTIP
jgi:hypothetical protein